MKNILHNFSSHGKPEPPVFTTIATEGQGIPELYLGLMNLTGEMELSGQLETRRLERYKSRISDLIRERLEDEFWTAEKSAILEQAARSLDTVSGAPVDIANILLKNRTVHD